MKTLQIEEILKNNSYPGRGIIVGLDKSGENAFIAYFIMGRSENSRNRIFSKTDDGIIIYPFDESKVEDPSLIIYSPVREINNKLIVTNGDQTDTVYDFIKDGKSFEDALLTREFEPDRPNFTPRISAILHLDGEFNYQMSILKSSDEIGSGCNRFTYNYAPVKGLGHFIHTYAGDGNPIPSFYGEPEKIFLGDDFEAFYTGIWNSLNQNNKVSMYAVKLNLKDKTQITKIYNKNKGE
ncbi:MAG: IMP cyclohydrolase [Clostridia bacterium]|nr:IMP cyclohydrolase [Clostridia bacterium]